jgi:hypothetical protein
MGPDEVAGRDRHILEGCDIERRKRECAKPQGRGYRARGEFWARPRSRIHSGFRLALAAIGVSSVKSVKCLVFDAYGTLFAMCNPLLRHLTEDLPGEDLNSAKVGVRSSSSTHGCAR